MTEDTRQNVVIVGGGTAGAAIAKSLAAKIDKAQFRLVLITARPYYVHLPGMIRTAVTAEGSLEKEVLMPYGDFMKGNGEVKTGKVISFTSTEEGNGGGVVTLEGGEEIPYTILVLATGNTWNGVVALPDDPAAVTETITSWRSKFASANNIVLAGGGAVAIETAGEILDFYPGKKITIVHAEGALLNDAYPAKWRGTLLSRLQREGVKVILSDHIDSTEPVDGAIATRKGESVPADLVVPCWGGRPNTAIVKAALGDDVLSATGHVKVQPTLQVQAHPRIFAAGDIIEWKEQKQAAKAPNHAAVVVANVLALLNGTPGTVQYKGSTELILITLGRNGGFAHFGILCGISLGDWFARMLKSKSLMIGMTRSANGFAAPSS